VIYAATGEEGIGNGYLPRRDHGLLLIGWEKLRLNMMIGRVFLEIMRLELTALIFVTTRPLPSKLWWHLLLQKLKILGIF